MARDKKFRGNNNGETPGPGSYKIEGKLGQGGKSGNRFGQSGLGKQKEAAGEQGKFYNIPSSIPDVAKYLLPENDKRKIHL